MLLGVAILIMILPTKVSAASLCENKVLSDYKSLASNINIYYTYSMQNGKPVFDITISNIYEDIYIVDTTKNKTYKYQNFTSDYELILKGYTDNQRVKFQIYTSVSGCYGQLLSTRYVTLPNYNEYSDDNVCAGAEDYSLCQKWGAMSLSYEEFVSRVEKYKESKSKPPVVEEEEDKTLSLTEQLFRFVGKYYVFLVGGIIIIILIIAAIRNISLRKNQFDFKV
jgi:hypothetical protein